MKGIEPHLPVLTVLIPLFGALFTAFFWRGASAWFVALVATSKSFGCQPRIASRTAPPTTNAV